MAWGLPKLPGLTFSDPTKTQYHIKSSLRYYQGHRFPDTVIRGPGGTATDVDSNAFALTEDSVNYDPSLTYGRVKQPALPAVVPHWVHYDKRCLNFTAFFKQPVFENPDENYRVRIVNIVYFLEDDSITVMEPRVQNSGIWQGRLVKRGKIPKNDIGECWHWKDLDIGKDICIYGKVFHTVSCDLFTRFAVCWFSLHRNVFNLTCKYKIYTLENTYTEQQILEQLYNGQKSRSEFEL